MLYAAFLITTLMVFAFTWMYVELKHSLRGRAAPNRLEFTSRGGGHAARPDGTS